MKSLPFSMEVRFWGDRSGAISTFISRSAEKPAVIGLLTNYFP
jgi:hypothetical protein